MESPGDRRPGTRELVHAGRHHRDHRREWKNDHDGPDRTHPRIVGAGGREHRTSSVLDGGGFAAGAMECTGAFELPTRNDAKISSAHRSLPECDAGPSRPPLHLRKLRRREGPLVRQSARERFFGPECRRCDLPPIRHARGGRPVWFSSAQTVSPGAFLDNGSIILDGEKLMAASEVPLRGVHNLENTMAAAAIARLAGASHEQIRAAVMTFPGVEHRIEFVRELNGVSYYNDSKATNVDATLKAVHAFDGGLWIILGGKDKNSDYTILREPLRAKAKAALLIGAAAPKIEEQLRGSVEMIRCGTLERAVSEGFSRAGKGDTVLLAPACASFDQFENFEHRGREFKRMVGELSWPS